MKCIFNNNELEIAVVTYNRSSFVNEWLRKCYREACIRNIRISIYDSSTDDSTKNLIDKFNIENDISIKYKKIDPSTVIGYKPMYPILQSKAKYVWVSGDSRYHDFNELDKKVFPYIKQGIDYIVLHILNNSDNDGKIYNDLGEFIHDCFISSTCIGLSIYKTDIFKELKNNKDEMGKYHRLFDNNYGFAWLGYFYSEFAKGGNKAAFAKVAVNNIFPRRKVQSWAKRFYGCWVDDLCNIIDNIPESYTQKNSIPKETWEIMSLDNHAYSYRARVSGDLNIETYKKYKESGLLGRVVDDDSRIHFYAAAPMYQVNIVYVLGRGLSFLKKRLEKIF